MQRRFLCRTKLRMLGVFNGPKNQCDMGYIVVASGVIYTYLICKIERFVRAIKVRLT